MYLDDSFTLLVYQVYKLRIHELSILVKDLLDNKLIQTAFSRNFSYVTLQIIIHISIYKVINQ